MSISAKPRIETTEMELPITWIRPPRGLRTVDMGELWRYRELLYFLVWRDIKVRYKQTALGAAWAVLQPTLMMVVFTIFFGRMAKIPSGDYPYPVFVLLGILPWTFFSTAVTSAANSVVGSERLVTKIYFPRLTVPFAAAAAAIVEFLIGLGLLFGLVIYYGISLGLSLLLVPLVFGILLVAALGIGTFLSAVNVAYRDVKYVIPFLIQIWLFATPTIYMEPKNVANGWTQFALALNPVTPLIATFRSAVLGGPIAWGPFGMATITVFLVFAASCLYFRNIEGRFADLI